MTSIRPILSFKLIFLQDAAAWSVFSKSLENNFENTALEPVSLIVIEVYKLRDINRVKGFDCMTMAHLEYLT